MTASSPAITIENVSKKYKLYSSPRERLLEAVHPRRKIYHKEFSALSSITLTINKGEAIGIVGRNGCGKSTLLKIVSGVLSPSTGTVKIEGRIAALLELGAGFNPELTGLENIRLSLLLFGIQPQDHQRYEYEIIDFAEIGHYIDQPVKVYSSGMFVRLAFAIATAVDPDIFIVDEALAVGDMLFQRKCFQKIKSFIERKKTFIFVSHDYELVRTLTNRAILLDDGKIIGDGNSKDIVFQYRALLHSRENSPTLQSTSSVQQSFGDGDCIVSSLQITNLTGSPKDIFYPNEEMTIAVECLAMKDIKSLSVGVRIRNKEGIKVYSGGTLNFDIARGQHCLWKRSFVAGEKFTVNFNISCRFGADLYEVQAYIAEEVEPFYISQRILHWRDEAAFFEVKHSKSEIFFGGIFDIIPNYSILTEEAR